MVEFNNTLLESNHTMNDGQYDVFDDFGNYRFPTDIKPAGPNIAYSSLEGYLYSLKVGQEQEL